MCNWSFRRCPARRFPVFVAVSHARPLLSLFPCVVHLPCVRAAGRLLGKHADGETFPQRFRLLPLSEAIFKMRKGMWDFLQPREVTAA